MIKMDAAGLTAFLVETFPQVHSDFAVEGVTEQGCACALSLPSGICALEARCRGQRCSGLPMWRCIWQS